MPGKNGAWRCSVCGYIHRGPEPPDLCPVCGASSEEFEAYADPAPPLDRPKVERWQCLVCKYVHAGPEPPEACPVCGALADSFEAISEVVHKTAEAGKATKVIIVGAGIAGIAAVESLREVAPEAEITLISKEPALPYYRLNLTRYLAGEINEQDLPIHSEDWYRERNVWLFLGSEVSAVRLEDRSVEIGDGQKLPFENLVALVGMSCEAVPVSPGEAVEKLTTSPPRGAEKR